jgi:hypothetical protein
LHHRRAADHLADEYRLEVTAGDWILVQLADGAGLFQDVERRRIAAGAALENCDGVRVLLTAKHQLRLALALHRCTPHRERDAKHDGHHRHADEQRRHRVAAFAALSHPKGTC